MRNSRQNFITVSYVLGLKFNLGTREGESVWGFVKKKGVGYLSQGKHASSFLSLQWAWKGKKPAASRFAATVYRTRSSASLVNFKVETTFRD